MSEHDGGIEIRKGAGGETAYIAGTRVRVSDVARLFQLVQEELVIEQMRRHLPSLSHGQFADALAFWRDHRKLIEAEIEEEDRVMATIPPAR